jgi:hypothetical protein
MLSFLGTIWNEFTGEISKVYHWVLNIIASVYSYVDRLWHILSTDLIHFGEQLRQYADETGKWITQTVSWLLGLIENGLRDVERWALGLLNDLRNYAESVYHWALNELNYIRGWVQTLWDQLYRWVLTNVFDPLDNFIKGIYAWALRYISYMYDLLTHPEKLAALLGKYILDYWLFFARKFAIPVVRWWLHNLKALVPDFVQIMEDILHGIL